MLGKLEWREDSHKCCQYFIREQEFERDTQQVCQAERSVKSRLARKKRKRCSEKPRTLFYQKIDSKKNSTQQKKTIKFLSNRTTEP